MRGEGASFQALTSVTWSWLAVRRRPVVGGKLEWPIRPKSDDDILDEGVEVNSCYGLSGCI